MLKVKIKEGARIFHDHHFIKWPYCLPPESEYHNTEYQYKTKFPNAVFDAFWNNNHWDCRKNGYGSKEDYGNGSIFVFDKDGIEIIK